MTEARRARWPRLLLLLVVAGAAAGVWWWRLRPPDIAPPVLPARLSEADPSVVTMIQRGAAIVEANLANSEAWQTLGMMYEANGFFTDAVTCYQTAGRLTPDDWFVWYRLALVLGEDMAQVEEAMPHMQRAADLNSAYAPAHWRLGLWLLDSGRVTEAMSRFERSLQVDAGSVPARLGLARVHINQQAYQEAVDQLGPLWQRPSSNTAYASLLVGQAYRGLGHVEAAREALARGEGSAPDLTDEYQSLYMQYRVGVEPQMDWAKTLAQQGQTARAVEVLEGLLDQRPGDPNLLSNLSIAYRADNQLDQAERTARDLLAEHPDYAPAHLSLALTLTARSATVVDSDEALRAEAMTHLEHALQVNPSYADALSQKAAMLEEDGRITEAAVAWMDAVRTDPTNPFSRYQAGRVARLSGATAQSIELLERAVAVAPIPAAHLELAHAYLDQQRLEDAARMIARAMDLAPGQPGLQELIDRLRSMQ